MVTMMIASAATANAATQASVQAQTPLDALGGPVGPAAIGLGLAGMVAGVLRRKKATVQPENERKS